MKRYLHLKSFMLTMKRNSIPWMQKNHYDTKQMEINICL